MEERVILVDIDDNEIGTEEKLIAHIKGKLHRAFSILIFNTKGELLLQKRAVGKYHSGGLWTNTCCSHPRPNEEIINAAHRRLKEEMNLDTNLHYIEKFIYKINLGKLSEHEFDYIYIGITDDKPTLNRDEASDYKYDTLQKITNDLKCNPEEYTFWFKTIINIYSEQLNEKLQTLL